MKTIKYLFVIVLTLLSVAGCNGQTEAKKTGEKAAKEGIEHLTTATFKQKVFDFQTNKTWKFAGDKPCIIDFYASWCGPCRLLAPTLEKVAQENKGKIDVYKVDVDAQQELANAFGISSIPAVLFCPKAGAPQMSQGLISKADFDKAIKEVLKVN